MTTFILFFPCSLCSLNWQSGFLKTSCLLCTQLLLSCSTLAHWTGRGIRKCRKSSQVLICGADVSLFRFVVLIACKMNANWPKQKKKVQQCSNITLPHTHTTPITPSLYESLLLVFHTGSTLTNGNNALQLWRWTTSRAPSVCRESGGFHWGRDTDTRQMRRTTEIMPDCWLTSGKPQGPHTNTHTYSDWGLVSGSLLHQVRWVLETEGIPSLPPTWQPHI